jgi:hypothetical protein
MPHICVFLQRWATTLPGARGFGVYIHRNPVKRGLVERPEQWRWSSARHYLLGEPGSVLVNERVAARMRCGMSGERGRGRVEENQNLLAAGGVVAHLCKKRKGGASSVVVAPAKLGQPPDYLR